MWIRSLVGLSTRLFLWFAERFCIGSPDAVKVGIFPIYIRRRKNFQILIYHRIGEDPRSLFDIMPIAEFKRQMDLLVDRFCILPLDELVLRSIESDIPPNALAITFDDGYKDNYDYAYPILKERGIPATIFLTTGSVGTNDMLWHDKIFSLFDLKSSEIRIHGRNFDIRDQKHRKSILEDLVTRLKRLDPESREKIINDIYVENGPMNSEMGDRKMLNWDEIREMASCGISMGSHTMTHTVLTSMPRYRAESEIIESRRQITENIGCPVNTFAYPNGKKDDFDIHMQNILKDIGFVCAVTSIWGNNEQGTNPFELRRIGLRKGDPEKSALRIACYKSRG